MNVLITGSTGLIGSALIHSLKAQQHSVYRMHRGERSGQCKSPFSWLPNQNIIHYDDSITIDVIIHLSGQNIAQGRWNVKRKQEIIESRVHSTRLLVKTIMRLKQPPKLFLCASAIGFYGDTRQHIADESDALGTGFLAEVCTQWEASSKPLLSTQTRLVYMRFGVVLDPKGGMLAKMLPVFKMGLGGLIGDGQQYMSWVSLKDLTQMVIFIMEHQQLCGPINIVSPSPIPNYQWVLSLASILKRPAYLPVPATIIKLLFGEMGEQLLLTNARVLPRKMQEAGYVFSHPTIDDALDEIIE